MMDVVKVIPDFNVYALIDSTIIANNQTVQSNLLQYDHPIVNLISHVPIKIIYGENEEAEQIMGTHAYSDRDHNIYISVATITLCQISIIFGLLGWFNEFLIAIAIMFLIESFLANKFLNDEYVFEFVLIFISCFIGYLIHLSIISFIH